ncbi:hypothetical protein GOV03_01620 [Candidatus Woesearchaeota archaeon]|nr:hypothetical protein [Candidatus Woesearchaeota archaeon]
MGNMVFEGEADRDPSEEELLDEDGISTEEEAFMRGYSDEDEEVTCAECGIAIQGEHLTKEISGENHKFCSKDCVQEFEEGMG